MITIYPRAGDWGTVLRFRMLQYDGDPLDLSTASAIKLYMRSPSDVTVSFDASLVTDGTDGKAEATITNGSWSAYGIYTLEPVATFASGEWAGSPWAKIEVKPSLRT